jgi:hypothetical protein
VQEEREFISDHTLLVLIAEALLYCVSPICTVGSGSPLLLFGVLAS